MSNDEFIELIDNFDSDNPISFLDKYVKIGGKYTSGFLSIRDHISDLDENAFRSPFDRKNSITQKIIGLFTQRKHNLRIVYLVIQTKDLFGNPLPNPIVCIGKTKQTLKQRFSGYKSEAKSLSFQKLNYRGEILSELKRFIEAGAPLENSFEIIPWDLASSDRELKSLEEFWTIYFNRYNFEQKYDLSINQNYNRRIGQLIDQDSHIYIDKEHMASLIRIGFRQLDLAAYFGLSLGGIEKKIKQLWGSEWNFSDVRKIEMGDHILELFEDGFSLQEIIDKGLLVHGIFEAFDANGKKRNIKDITFNEISKFISYSYSGIATILRDWFQKNPSQLYSELYLEPNLHSLYCKGYFTKEDIINYWKTSSSRSVREQLNPKYRALLNFKDCILEIDFLLMLQESLSYKEIAVQFGLIDSDISPNDPMLRKARKMIENILHRIFPGMDKRQVEIFLNNHYLGDVEGGGYFYYFKI